MNHREYKELVRYIWRHPNREQNLGIAIAYAQRPPRWSKPYALDAIAAQFGVDTKTVRRAIKQFGHRVPGYLAWQGLAPYRSKDDAAAQSAQAQAGLAALRGAFDGFAEFFDLLGYDNLMLDLPPSELLARLEAAGLIRPRDKSPD